MDFMARGIFKRILTPALNMPSGTPEYVFKSSCNTWLIWAYVKKECMVWLQANSEVPKEAPVHRDKPWTDGA